MDSSGRLGVPLSNIFTLWKLILSNFDFFLNVRINPKIFSPNSRRDPAYDWFRSRGWAPLSKRVEKTLVKESDAKFPFLKNSEYGKSPGLTVFEEKIDEKHYSILEDSAETGMSNFSQLSVPPDSLLCHGR